MSGHPRAIDVALRPIDPSEVRRVARLARLEIEDDELARLSLDLARIVEYVDSLPVIDVDEESSSAEPSWRCVAAMPLRDDDPGASLSRDEVLAAAPLAHDGGFAVPTFVDEG